MSLTYVFSKLCIKNSVPIFGLATFTAAAAAATASAGITRRLISTTALCSFKLTPMLAAEPLKKKKKLDPQIIKAREERRRKKIEKQIRRLEKNARQLKPIDELEIPLVLIDEKDKRTRAAFNLSDETLEKRALLEKKWARYKHDEKLQHFQIIDRILMAQEKALQELRYESEDLYEEAIQPDLTLVPFNATGPVATPSIENYDSPDGEYLNISKKWDQ